MHLSTYTDGTGGPYCDAESGPTTSIPQEADCERCMEYYMEARGIEEPSLEEIRQDLEWRTGS